MSLINQALKKAQREQLLHGAQILPRLPHTRASGQFRPWFLIVVGCAMALVGGASLHFWLATPSRPVVATSVAEATRQPTPVAPNTPSHSSPVPPAPRVITAKRPASGVPEVPGRSPRSRVLPPAGAHPTPGGARQKLRTVRTVQPSVASLPRNAVRTVPAPQEPSPRARAKAYALFNRAAASQEAGHQAQALTLLQQAVAYDPTLKIAYNSLGNLYYQQRQYHQATAMYQKALSIDPDYAKARNNLGSTYMQLAENDRAIEELQKALQADRSYGLAYYNLACVYARSGESRAAARYLRHAMALEPQARTWAQSDEDFVRVRNAPVIRQLLGP